MLNRVGGAGVPPAPVKARKTFLLLGYVRLPISTVTFRGILLLLSLQLLLLLLLLLLLGLLVLSRLDSTLILKGSGDFRGIHYRKVFCTTEVVFNEKGAVITVALTYVDMSSV